MDFKDFKELKSPTPLDPWASWDQRCRHTHAPNLWTQSMFSLWEKKSHFGNLS